MISVPTKFFFLTWIVVAFGGGLILLRFENSPGSAGSTPDRWPEDAEFAINTNRYRLLMFAHPHCPCTRTSIGELNRLLARTDNNVQTHVHFFKPSDRPDDWVRTGSWNEASTIPGVSVHIDTEGAVAQKFGAETSGYVVLFNPEGQLLFKGGITAGRSHAGDNAGASLIVSLLRGDKPPLDQTPVYGCSIAEVSENKP